MENTASEIDTKFYCVEYSAMQIKYSIFVLSNQLVTKKMYYPENVQGHWYTTGPERDMQRGIALKISTKKCLYNSFNIFFPDNKKKDIYK